MSQHYIPASHIPARFKREATRHPYKPHKCPVEREYKFDGRGGYAKNSGRIPFVETLLYVGGTAITIWATLGFAHWIWG